MTRARVQFARLCSNSQKTQIFVLRARFLCKQSRVAPSKTELGFLSKSPLCSPSSLCLLSPLPQFRRPSMSQFGSARWSAREWERGWNVLKAETFLIVHSHRPYVRQPESRDGALPQPWEAKALSPPQSHSNPIMQATCLHNSGKDR